LGDFSKAGRGCQVFLKHAVRFLLEKSAGIGSDMHIGFDRHHEINAIFVLDLVTLAVNAQVLSGKKPEKSLACFVRALH